MRNRWHGTSGSVSSYVHVTFLAAFVLLALLIPFAPSARAATVNVSIVDLAFQPKTVNIQLMDTVIWTNNGDLTHTVTSDGGAGPLSSNDLNKGDTYSFTFTSEGTFQYHCKFHPTMTGTITVGSLVPEFSSAAFVTFGLVVVLLGMIVLSRRA